MESHFLDVDGTTTHCLVTGDGPPLVLVHGGGPGADARGNWQDCMPLFANNFEIFAVDMVGFGETDKPDPDAYAYTKENRSRHLADFIASLDKGPVSIIGNSMGGAAAIGVAMERPDLIRRMVLMGSAGIAVNNPDPAPMKALASYDYTLDGMRRMMRVLAGPDYEVDEDLATYRHELSLDPARKSAMTAIITEARQGGLAYEDDAIRQIKLPTLVVGGKEDQIAIPARNYRFLELLDNSWGFILPHCGHWVMMERPQEFAAVTLDFLLGESYGSS
jgi:pimeloyl-ACP methyl ester carboxylesterase